MGEEKTGQILMPRGFKSLPLHYFKIIHFKIMKI